MLADPWQAKVYGCSRKDQFNMVKWKRLCERVNKRDGGKCRSCGSKKNLTTHHILPRSK